MKSFYRYLAAIFVLVLFLFPTENSKAGNKDRSGQAGASELLINPWSRSAGWGSVNVAGVRGLESMYVNIAGLGFTSGTQIGFVNTQWLKGSDIKINSFGFASKMGESGVLGISVMSMSFGEMDVTTTSQPEGGIGTFSPSYMNVNIGYARSFSSSIYGGINLKIISESISDMKAQGVAIDAGIQYVTGELENIKFGIALKNVGPTMNFSGDGLAMRVIPDDQTTSFTLEERKQAFEMPAQLLIGAGYDFLFEGNSRLTVAGNFTSNSFSKDQFTGGLEFSLREYVILRGSYTYEEGITDPYEDSENRTTVFSGISAGFTVQVPLNKEKGSSFAFDYAFRSTDSVFDNTHSFGVIVTF
jgi:hypothetical protein